MDILDSLMGPASEDSAAAAAPRGGGSTKVAAAAASDGASSGEGTESDTPSTPPAATKSTRKKKAAPKKAVVPKTSGGVKKPKSKKPKSKSKVLKASGMAYNNDHVDQNIVRALSDGRVRLMLLQGNGDTKGSSVRDRLISFAHDIMKKLVEKAYLTMRMGKRQSISGDDVREAARIMGLIVC